MDLETVITLALGQEVKKKGGHESRKEEIEKKKNK